MRKSTLLAMSVLMAMSSVGSANAATTANLGVKIVIEEGCTIETPAELDFGTSGLLASNIDASSSLSVTCTNTTDYKVSLGTGNGTGATESSRKMSNGSETVSYGLYQDASRSQVWGSGSNEYSGIGNGQAQTIPVYGRVPSQDTPSAGTYTDTVTVAVSY